jgi:hypothetical protein
LETRSIGKMVRMRMLREIILCILFLYSSSLVANQYLPGQLDPKDSIYEKKSDDDDDEKESVYLESQGKNDEYLGNYEAGSLPSYGLPGNVKEDKKLLNNSEKNLTGFQQELSLDNKNSYYNIKQDTIFQNVYDKGDRAFSFFYVKDDYDVVDETGVFQRTFEDSTGSVRGGNLMFSMMKYWYRGRIQVAGAINFGFGYSEGRGIFETSRETSETTFSLWALPLDAALSFEIPVGRFFNLALSGGPSALGLYQLRDDREQGDAQKRKRQVSWGYHAMGKVKISISNLLKSSSKELYSEYDVTNFYLDLILRYQNFENFQDNITISGTSVGIGFTFDYL